MNFGSVERCNLENSARAGTSPRPSEGRGQGEGFRSAPSPVPLRAADPAHELRNVITGLVGHLGLLRENSLRSPQLLNDVTLLEKAAHRARALSLELDG